MTARVQHHTVVATSSSSASVSSGGPWAGMDDAQLERFTASWVTVSSRFAAILERTVEHIRTGTGGVTISGGSGGATSSSRSTDSTTRDVGDAKAKLTGLAEDRKFGACCDDLRRAGMVSLASFRPVLRVVGSLFTRWTL